MMEGDARPTAPAIEESRDVKKLLEKHKAIIEEVKQR